MQTALRYLLLLPLLLATWRGQAQAVTALLQKESFEYAPGAPKSKVDVANTTTYAYATNGSAKSYFLRTSNAEINNSASNGYAPGSYAVTGGLGYTADSAYYWTGDNVRFALTSGISSTSTRSTGIVTLKPVTVSGYSNLKVVMGLAIARRANDRMETDDVLQVQVRFGSGSWTTIGMLKGDGATPGTSGFWRQDVDNDGSVQNDKDANGPAVTTSLSDFTFNVTGSGSSMQVRIVVDEFDGSEDFYFDNIRVTGEPSNNATPVLAGIESFPLTYTEGNPATQVTSGLTVTDADHATLIGARVSITQNFDSSEDLLLFTNQNGITSAYSSSTGVLSLTGTASLSSYQAALRSVRYQNTDGVDPLGLPRTIRFTVTDPAGAVSAAVERVIDVRPTLTVVGMPYAEDLTTDGEGIRYTSNYFTNTQSGTSAAFIRTNVNPNTQNTQPAQQTTFSNISNTWYWYSNVSANNTYRQPFNIGYFQTQPVSTAGYVNLSFQLRLAARSGTFNLNDYVRVYYRSNTGSWVLLGQFRGLGSATDENINGDLKQDLDVANIGTLPTGPSLTPALVNFPFSLPASVNGTQLDFKIETYSTLADEQIAFDLLQLTGTQVVAPTVTTAAATTVTGTSAVLGGQVTADGGATVTSRGVVYSSSNTDPTVGGTGVTTDSNGSGTGTFSKAITGLAAGTTYYVRAYATNSVGTSYGAVQNFTTPTTVVSIVRADPSPTNANSVSYTVTFANPVTGISVNNFSITPFGTEFTSSDSITSLSGSGTTYTVTMNTGTGSGALRLNLANSTGISPSVSNVPYTAGAQYTVDRAAPTVAISSSAGPSGGTTTTTPIPFTVTFSESVTGFVSGDLTVSNGTVSGFSGSGTTYTFNVTPTTPGTASAVTVPTNVAQDAVGNGNTSAPASYSLTYNLSSAIIQSITRLTPSPTATTTVQYQVVFSSAVSNLSLSNFAVTASPGLSGAGVQSLSGSGTNYKVAVNTGTGSGTLRLDLNNGTGISPSVSNLPYSSAEQYTITKSFPAEPILRIQGEGSVSGNSDVTAFVDQVQLFSGGTPFANGLQNSSFESSNVAAGNFLYSPSVVATPWSFGTQSGVSRNDSGFGSTAATGDAVAFLQSTSGNNGNVSQTLAVPSGSYQVSLQAAQRDYSSKDQVVSVFVNDVFVGSIQPPSTSAYQSFTSAPFAVAAPALTATISSSAGASGSTTSISPIPVTVTFSASVTGFTASGVAVSNGLISDFSGSGATYTFNVTPSTSGTISVNVPANSAVDANTTGNTAAVPFTITYSQAVTAAPTVLVPANSGDVASVTPTYEGTAVAGSTVTVYVDGSDIGRTTASARGVWSLTQPPALAQGSHTVYATAQLSGQAVSATSSTNTFIVDTVRPTVTISSTASNPTSTSPIPVTVTFSENVTGFVTGDMIVTNGTITGFAGSGTTFTFSVTPTTSGTVTVSIGVNVAQDRVGNGNTAALPFSTLYNQPQTVAPVVITPANGSTVANTLPAYTGSAPASSTVTVYVDGASIGTSTATGAGTFSLIQPTSLAQGSHTVYATAQLSGQALSAASSTNTFTVSTSATYLSSTADQPNVERVPGGSTNQVLLRLAVVIGGTSSPLSAQDLAFTTNGSTAAADIAAARVYYTGTSNTFAATTLFGSAVATPSGAFTITGTQQLTTGTNYFWLVYDVAEAAIPGNVLDATVTRLRLSGTEYTPSVTAPAGNRQIIQVSRVAGNAAHFTGSGSIGYVNFSTTPLPVLGAQYSQEVWIKPTLSGIAGSTYYVLGNGTTGSMASPFIAIGSAGRVFAGFGTGSVLFVNGTNSTPLNSVVSNTWSHVVTTYDGANLRIYVNGDLITAVAAPVGAVPAATPVAYIGNAASSAATSFPGDIDEVSMWNRALSQTEIRQRRHLVRTGVEEGLVSYLQFNESSTTATDAISSVVGTFTGSGTSRVTSTAPIGSGSSNLQSITSASNYSFAATNAAIDFTTVASTPYDVVITRLEGKPQGTQVSDALLRSTYTRAYWIVDKYSLSNFTADITYTLDQGLLSADDAVAPSNLKLYKRDSNSDGTFDAPISATAASATASTVTFPVTSFSQTFIGSYGNSPLPVTLLSFRAERRNNDALLHWATAQELNNAYFEVESSADGRTFRAIGRVKGQGTSAQPHQYQFPDINLNRYARPVVYYRLRQVDTNGNTSFSPVQTVQVPKEASLLTAMVFPNPATDQLTIRLSSPYTGHARGWLFDAQGRSIQELSRQLAPAAGTDIPLSVKQLPNGVYTLRLVLDGQVIHQQIVVQR